MANAATKDSVQKAIRPANYRAAVQLVRSKKTVESQMATKRKSLQEIDAKIDGHGVNTKGAKIFERLDKMETVDRNDVLRSLKGLIDVAEWDDEGEDLVDTAEGKESPMRLVHDNDKPANGEEADPNVNDDAGDDDFEMSDEELAAQEGRSPPVDEPEVAAKKKDAPKK